MMHSFSLLAAFSTKIAEGESRAGLSAPIAASVLPDEAAFRAFMEQAKNKTVREILLPPSTSPAPTSQSAPTAFSPLSTVSAAPQELLDPATSQTNLEPLQAALSALGLTVVPERIPTASSQPINIEQVLEVAFDQNPLSDAQIAQVEASETLVSNPEKNPSSTSPAPIESESLAQTSSKTQMRPAPREFRSAAKQSTSPEAVRQTAKTPVENNAVKAQIPQKDADTSAKASTVLIRNATNAYQPTIQNVAPIERKSGAIKTDVAATTQSAPDARNANATTVEKPTSPMQFQTPIADVLPMPIPVPPATQISVKNTGVALPAEVKSGKKGDTTISSRNSAPSVTQDATLPVKMNNEQASISLGSAAVALSSQAPLNLDLPKVSVRNIEPSVSRESESGVNTFPADTAAPETLSDAFVSSGASKTTTIVRELQSEGSTASIDSESGRAIPAGFDAVNDVKSTAVKDIPAAMRSAPEQELKVPQQAMAVILAVPNPTEPKTTAPVKSSAAKTASVHLNSSVIPSRGSSPQPAEVSHAPQIRDSVPAEKYSALSDVPPQPADGTQGATSGMRMKTAQEQNKAADSTTQKVPAVIVHGDIATGGGNNSSTNTSSGGRNQNSEGFTQTIVANVAVKAADFTAEAPKTLTATAVTSDHNLSAVERIGKFVDQQVSMIRQAGSNHLAVSLKLDPHTELSLQLTSHNGQIEASVSVERGSVDGLSAHWKELQDSLGKQNVQLAPLESKPAARATASFASTDAKTGSSNGASSQNSSRQTREQRHEFPSYAGTFRTSAAGSAATVATTRTASRGVPQQGWESWA